MESDFCRPDPDPAKETTSVKMSQWKGHGDTPIVRYCRICGVKMLVEKHKTGTKYCEEHKPDEH